MKLSCCCWTLTLPAIEAVAEVAALGFHWVDVQAPMLRTPSELQQLALLPCQIGCVGLSFGLSSDTRLDHPEAEKRQAAIDYFIDGVQQAAALNAKATYVVPDLDGSAAALARYGDSLRKVADAALAHQLPLCVEHFPGRSLPTAAATLAYIQKLDHPNLYLLYDSGHVQMSHEDPAATIALAGDRLGYVHLDDNNGKDDLHWALTDGVMTEETLADTLNALQRVGYCGFVSLELSSALAQPKKAIADGRRLVVAIGGDQFFE